MKKIMIFLAIFLCSMVFAKSNTDNEKKELLRQFVAFREALKNKDIKTVKSVMEFPLNDEYEILFSGSKLYSDKEYIKAGKISEKLFDKYSDKFSYEIFEDFEKIKIDLEKNKITEYFLDGTKVDGKKMKFYWDENEHSYYYKDKDNKKVYKNTCNLNINAGFDVAENNQTLFYASSFFEDNELTEAKEICFGGVVFTFKLDNGKLKLNDIFEKKKKEYY